MRFHKIRQGLENCCDSAKGEQGGCFVPAANLPTNIADFRGFDSSTILILRGWNAQAHRDCLGIFPESLTRTMLVGTMLVGGLGVSSCAGPGRRRDARLRVVAVVLRSAKGGAVEPGCSDSYGVIYYGTV